MRLCKDEALRIAMSLVTAENRDFSDVQAVRFLAATKLGENFHPDQWSVVFGLPDDEDEDVVVRDPDHFIVIVDDATGAAGFFLML